MKFKIIFSSLVKDDLREAQHWYKKINRKLASDFLKEFRKKINYIAKNPSACEVKYDNIRICFFNRFPYGIHYQFLKDHSLVRVFSVFHTSRNPVIWLQRKG